MEIIANHTKETEVLDEKQNLLFFEAVARVISATRKLSPGGSMSKCSVETAWLLRM